MPKNRTDDVDDTTKKEDEFVVELLREVMMDEYKEPHEK